MLQVRGAFLPYTVFNPQIPRKSRSLCPRAPAGDRALTGCPLGATATGASIQKLKAIHDATHPGAKLEPATSRAVDLKTEAEHAALLEALDAETEGDHD
jgi:hypothetical protein